MKKILSILFILFLSLTLITCGGGGGGGDDDDDDGPTGSINVNRSFTGSLGTSDDMIGGIYHDIYEIENVPEGADITVELSSSDFDAYLTLYYGDATSGEIVDEDDDGSGGTDAFIYVTASNNGSYYIFVSSFEAGETGNYSMNYTVYKEADDSEEEEGDDDDDDSSGGGSGCSHSRGCGVCSHFSYSSCSCVKNFYCLKHLNEGS